MRRLQEPFRRRSPVLSVSAPESFRISTSSDALASAIKVFDVAETAVDPPPTPGLKPVISTIRAVQFVEVKVIGRLCLG